LPSLPLLVSSSSSEDLGLSFFNAEAVVLVVTHAADDGGGEVDADAFTAGDAESNGFIVVDEGTADEDDDDDDDDDEDEDEEEETI